MNSKLIFFIKTFEVSDGFPIFSVEAVAIADDVVVGVFSTSDVGVAVDDESEGESYGVSHVWGDLCPGVGFGVESPEVVEAVGAVESESDVCFIVEGEGDGSVARHERDRRIMRWAR